MNQSVLQICATKLRFSLRQTGADSDFTQNFCVKKWWVEPLLQILENNYLKIRGDQWPFGTLPKLHPFWWHQPSLIGEGFFYSGNSFPMVPSSMRRHHIVSRDSASSVASSSVASLTSSHLFSFLFHLEKTNNDT